MLTKPKIQHLRSLHNRKSREELGLFLVEGKKSILEVVNSSLEIVEGYVTYDFIGELRRTFPLELITQKELERITTLASNRDGVFVVRIPHTFDALPQTGFILVLDGINDPGNLGTIMRTADWYGIETIVTSEDTVDAYNPKTIMASMGSFTRVRVICTDIARYLSEK